MNRGVCPLVDDLTCGRYDDLHPTERVVRIIAETFIKVVKMKSKYGHYYGERSSSLTLGSIMKDRVV